MTEPVAATPAGYTTVAPWVVTDDTGAFLDFVVHSFGGTELARVATEDGLIGHGEVRVGDTVVLAFDRRPEWPRMPSLLRVFVADADAAFDRAAAVGPAWSRRWPTARSASGAGASWIRSGTSGGW